MNDACEQAVDVQVTVNLRFTPSSIRQYAKDNDCQWWSGDVMKHQVGLEVEAAVSGALEDSRLSEYATITTKHVSIS